MWYDVITLYTSVSAAFLLPDHGAANLEALADPSGASYPVHGAHVGGQELRSMTSINSTTSCICLCRIYCICRT